MEAVPGKIQDPLPAEFPQLGGKGAAVHRKIVRHLLAVKGNGEFRAARLLGLGGQVGENLLAGSGLSQVFYFPGEKKVPLGQNPEKAAPKGKAQGLGFRLGEGGEKAFGGEEEDPAGLRCRHSHLHGAGREAGIALPEELPRPQLGQDAAATPEILPLDVNTAGEDQTHGSGGFPLAQEKGASGIFFTAGGEPSQQLFRFLAAHPLEQGRKLRKFAEIFHGKNLISLEIQHTVAGRDVRIGMWNGRNGPETGAGRRIRPGKTQSHGSMGGRGKAAPVSGPLKGEMRNETENHPN
jgi:hypothetical protein